MPVPGIRVQTRRYPVPAGGQFGRDTRDASGFQAGGAAAGGLTGALIGMGIPEYEAKRYEGKVKDGNILMSVHTEDSKERDRAKEIFVKGGAKHISYSGEAAADGRPLSATLR